MDRYLQVRASIRPVATWPGKSFWGRSPPATHPLVRPVEGGRSSQTSGATGIGGQSADRSCRWLIHERKAGSAATA